MAAQQNLKEANTRRPVEYPRDVQLKGSQREKTGWILKEPGTCSVKSAKGDGGGGLGGFDNLAA